jgi:hypothetical protein
MHDALRPRVNVDGVLAEFTSHSGSEQVLADIGLERLAQLLQSPCIPRIQPLTQAIVDFQFSRCDEFVNEVADFAEAADSGDVWMSAGGE